MAQQLDDDEVTFGVLLDIKAILRSIRFWVIVLVALAVLPLLFTFLALLVPWQGRF